VCVCVCARARVRVCLCVRVRRWWARRAHSGRASTTACCAHPPLHMHARIERACMHGRARGAPAQPSSMPPRMQAGIECAVAEAWLCMHRRQACSARRHTHARTPTLWKDHLSAWCAPALGAKLKVVCSPERSSIRQLRTSVFTASMGRSWLLNCSVHSSAPPLWNTANRSSIAPAAAAAAAAAAPALTPVLPAPAHTHTRTHKSL